MAPRTVLVMIQTVAVSGYRSLRDVVLPLGALTVVTGGNGTGKSSLYRAVSLIADASEGRLIGALAAAGGLSAVLWAGPEHISVAMKRGEVSVQGTGKRRRPIALQLGFASDDLGYLIDVGLPADRETIFSRDPVIKRELVWGGPLMRPASLLVERSWSKVRLRPQDRWEPVDHPLAGHESVLDELADPLSHPDLAAVRRRVRRWRFYDGFRVDAAAPARQPQVGTRTEILARDGHDLAPAIATIQESAWGSVFAEVIDRAFPGTRVGVAESSGRFEVEVRQPGLLRPLTGAELSDGTLRFLLLSAALLSPRPPSLLVVNEPETSLHPDLLPALGHLLVTAAERCQVMVITHSAPLVDELAEADAVRHELAKPYGETVVVDQGLLTRPAWAWGSR